MADVPTLRLDRFPPATRCAGHRSSDGGECQRWAVRGSAYCLKHGAALPTLRAVADARVEAARQALREAAPEAARELINLALGPDTPDYVKIRALAVLLDRAGIAPGVVISAQLSVTEAGSPAEIIRARLERLAAGSAAASAELLSGQVDDSV